MVFLSAFDYLFTPPNNAAEKKSPSPKEIALTTLGAEVIRTKKSQEELRQAAINQYLNDRAAWDRARGRVWSVYKINPNEGIKKKQE